MSVSNVLVERLVVDLLLQRWVMGILGRMLEKQLEKVGDEGIDGIIIAEDRLGLDINLYTSQKRWRNPGGRPENPKVRRCLVRSACKERNLHNYFHVYR